MKKSITVKKSRKANCETEMKEIRRMAENGRLTIGLDLGDRSSRYCILNAAAEVASEGTLPTTQAGLSSLLAKMPSSRVALEVGTHSSWVSRYITGLGHEAIVANPYKVKLITQSVRKNDRSDAEKLARLARVDPQLLSPIRHRGAQAQADLAVIRARAELVESRTGLINSVRGLVKSLGGRLRSCDADAVGEDLAVEVSAELQPIIEPLLRSVATLTEEIGIYEQRIDEITKRYPETILLKQVYGVGTLIALTYILTLEDAGRFQHSRDVGPFLGLQPKQRDSGESQPQLGISKTGDKLLRSYLVQAAHCMLRQGAPDSDLRAWGLAKAGSGAKRAKRRALVGMARKLAVLLHRLWVTGEAYDPLYNRKAASKAAAGKATAGKATAGTAA